MRGPLGSFVIRDSSLSNAYWLVSKAAESGDQKTLSVLIIKK